MADPVTFTATVGGLVYWKHLPISHVEMADIPPHLGQVICFFSWGSKLLRYFWTIIKNGMGMFLDENDDGHGDDYML